MLDVGMLIWLRANCRIQQSAISSTTSAQLVVGADPLRFAAILVGDDTTSTIYSITDGQSGFRHFIIPTLGASVTIDEINLGQFVRQPIYAQTGVGGRTIYVTTMSYEPSKRTIYDKLIRKQLSDSGAL